MCAERWSGSDSYVSPYQKWVDAGSPTDNMQLMREVLCLDAGHYSDSDVRALMPYPGEEEAAYAERRDGFLENRACANLERVVAQQRFQRGW